MGYPESNIEGLSPFGTLDYLWMKYTLYQVFTNSKFENNSDALEFMKLDDKEIGVFPFWKPSLFFVCSAWGRSCRRSFFRNNLQLNGHGLSLFHPKFPNGNHKKKGLQSTCIHAIMSLRGRH